MLNHHNGKHNVKHKINPYDALNKLDEVDYEMVASKAIGAGDQLYLSYNHGSISKEYLDWFGTPQMFLSFGSVEVRSSVNGCASSLFCCIAVELTSLIACFLGTAHASKMVV